MTTTMATTAGGGGGGCNGKYNKEHTIAPIRLEYGI